MSGSPSSRGCQAACTNDPKALGYDSYTLLEDLLHQPFNHNINTVNTTHYFTLCN